jgi:hypothetical protein
METEVAAEGGKENSAAPMASALLRLAAGAGGASAARRTPILCLGRPAPRRRRSRQPLGGAGFDGVRRRPVDSGANSVFGSHRAHSDKNIAWLVAADLTGRVVRSVLLVDAVTGALSRLSLEPSRCGSI